MPTLRLISSQDVTAYARNLERRTERARVAWSAVAAVSSVESVNFLAHIFNAPDQFEQMMAAGVSAFCCVVAGHAALQLQELDRTDPKTQPDLRL